MNVEVTAPNGNKSYPIYEPSHRNNLVKFYADYVIANPGAEVVIKDDKGEVVLALVG